MACSQALTRFLKKQAIDNKEFFPKVTQSRTVVLGIRSYERVLGDAHTQTIQRALATMRTLLLIGCGAGLVDPNFGALLAWMGEVFAASKYRHYRQAQHSTEQRTFALW